MEAESLADVVAREGVVVEQLVDVFDRGLRRCNTCLEALQPRQPGRITLMETRRKGAGKVVLNELRWRIVRWRIRRTYSDGSVEWTAQLLPLSGVTRFTSSKFNFHDTEPEVREVLKAAVALIEIRGRVLRTATNFVTGVGAQNRLGLPQAMKQIQRAVVAADRGARKRARIKVEVEQAARDQARPIKAGR
jgi:hypothetical protein